MYSSDSVCVCSVCLCAKCRKKVFERILMECCEEVKRGPGKNRLDFGGDPDSFVDLASFSRILYH